MECYIRKTSVHTSTNIIELSVGLVGKIIQLNGNFLNQILLLSFPLRHSPAPSIQA